MAIDLEPAVIWWHKGKLQVVLDTLKSLAPVYKDSKACDYISDAAALLVRADTEMTRMAEESNQRLFDEAMKVDSDEKH